MKKFFIGLALYAISTCSYSIETEVKGFIALDTLALEKQDGRSQTVETGIGVLDIKLYARQDDFQTKIKLDLDGNLGDKNNLFEEATVAYRPIYDLRLMFGKGKVPFHQMQYGVLESSYTDGGSLLGTTHSFRDQDRKIIVTARYGSYKTGFFNHFTFYGNSAQPDRLREDDTKLFLKKSFDEITYRNEKVFNTKFEKGFANKFEYHPFRGLKLAVAGLYFSRDIDPDADYAFDFSMKYDVAQTQFYFEVVYAYLSKHPNDKYTARRQNELFFQTGGEYRLTSTWALGVNIEAIFVNSQRHDLNDYPATVSGCTDNTDPDCYGFGQSFFNDGSRRETNNAKIELGSKHKLNRSLLFTVGTVFERRWDWVNGIETSKRDAYQLGSALSFWF